MIQCLEVPTLKPWLHQRHQVPLSLDVPMPAVGLGFRIGKLGRQRREMVSEATEMVTFLNRTGGFLLSRCQLGAVAQFEMHMGNNDKWESLFSLLASVNPR